MTENEKKNLSAIAAAMVYKEEKSDVPAGSIGELIDAVTREPDRKKRKKLIADFTARHKDAAAFLSENEDLINAEAEAALISAAVGGVHTDRRVSYKGGRRHEEIIHRKTPPNVTALSFLLKNRMPDKYSDKPAGDIEIEDTSEIEEAIENADEEDEGG